MGRREGEEDTVVGGGDASFQVGWQWTTIHTVGLYRLGPHLSEGFSHPYRR